MRRHHELKILPRYYNAIKEGIKTAELRLNDRDFQTGDLIILNEYQNGKITDRTLWCEITHIFIDESFLQKNCAMLSFKILEEKIHSK